MEDIFSKYTERHFIKSQNKIINENKSKSRDEDIIYTNTLPFSDKIYNAYYKINGCVGYMCPSCYNVEHIDTRINNEANLRFTHLTDDEIDEIESNKFSINVSYDVKARCSICKHYGKLVRLDENIADVIGILNIKGYITSSSSEGYKSPYGTIDPYISFNGLGIHYSLRTVSKIEKYIEDTLPLSWYMFRPNYVMSYSYSDYDTKAIVKRRRFIPFYMVNLFEIRADYYNKEEALNDILKWARSLPDLKKEGIL